ncbi:MAG TPA: NAD-dependent epimerase/dehydratase family protein [Gemmatimonadaceae bacterium]|nr:NAD-dependent epimerase/dehydratase family protein [Gemmatimonadaceae bacterium]
MKVFITGAAGFLGAHLADAFVRDGHETVACDNLIGGELENLPEGVDFEPADCCDLAAMKRLVRGVDVVYHCAALAPEGYSVFAPSIIAQHVYQNTASVLAAAANERVRRFVFCSSMARYGSGDPPFTEDQPTAPETPYSIAKVAAEALVRNVAETHGFEHVIAVPHNIIGPKQKYDDPYRNVAAIMINRMLQGQQPVIYGDGEQMRSFSFVQDCVNPLVQMATLPNLDGEVINIGPDEESVTINELAQLLAGMLDFNLDPIRLPERTREVKVATCSSEKARRLLGYQTTVSLREGLESMIDWIRAHGTKPFRHHLPIEIDSPLLPTTWRAGGFS